MISGDEELIELSAADREYFEVHTRARSIQAQAVNRRSK